MIFHVLHFATLSIIMPESEITLQIFNKVKDMYLALDICLYKSSYFTGQYGHLPDFFLLFWPYGPVRAANDLCFDCGESTLLHVYSYQSVRDYGKLGYHVKIKLVA